MKNIADFLKGFRLKKGLSEDDLIKKTSLTKSVIHLIERGEFESLGAEFYLKSFLSQYCNVIGLTERESEEIINKVISEVRKENSFVSNNNTKNNSFMLILLFFIIVAVVFFFLFNRYYATKNRNTLQRHELTVNGRFFMNNKVIAKKTLKEIGRVVKEREQIAKKVGEKERGEARSNSQTKDNNKQLNSVTNIKSVEKKITEKSLNPIDKAKVSDLKNKRASQSGEEVKETKKEIIKVSFNASCMCWVNISFEKKVIKDFILKPDEKYSIKVPEGSVITVGNASCLKLFFGNKEVNLSGEKLVKNILVE